MTNRLDTITMAPESENTNVKYFNETRRSEYLLQYANNRLSYKVFMQFLHTNIRNTIEANLSKSVTDDLLKKLNL